MRKLIWGKTFIRALKKATKKNPHLKKDIEDALGDLALDPFNPKLETHKLKGRLIGTWACSAGYDLRILFDFVKNKNKKDSDILLFEIGSHDEVY